MRIFPAHPFVAVAALGLFACAGTNSAVKNAETAAATRTAAESAILQADRDFSALASRQGPREAFSQYFAEDALALEDNEVPHAGLPAILESVPTGNWFISWDPQKAEASASGDLGYSWGLFQIEERSAGGVPSVRHGKYVSVWRKQPDGRWKVIVDIGNANPPLGAILRQEAGGSHTSAQPSKP